MRQIIMAGEDNTDGAVCVLGLFIGAAVSHNFGLIASPAGVPANGQIACIIGFAALTGIVLINIKQKGMVEA